MFGRRSVTFAIAQSHALGGLGDLTSSMLDLLDTQVAAVRIDSNVGPVTIPEPFHRSGASGSSTSTSVPGVPGVSSLPGAGSVKLPTIEQMLQPSYTFIGRDGGETTVSPFGVPTHDYRPLLIAGGLAILALAIYGGSKLARGK